MIMIIPMTVMSIQITFIEVGLLSLATCCRPCKADLCQCYDKTLYRRSRAQACMVLVHLNSTVTDFRSVLRVSETLLLHARHTMFICLLQQKSIKLEYKSGGYLVLHQYELLYAMVNHNDGRFFF
jgi:hypothetical protein